jgi:hypothetical protein
MFLTSDSTKFIAQHRGSKGHSVVFEREWISLLATMSMSVLICGGLFIISGLPDLAQTTTMIHEGVWSFMSIIMMMKWGVWIALSIAVIVVNGIMIRRGLYEWRYRITDEWLMHEKSSNPGSGKFTCIKQYSIHDIVEIHQAKEKIRARYTTQDVYTVVLELTEDRHVTLGNDEGDESGTPISTMLNQWLIEARGPQQPVSVSLTSIVHGHVPFEVDDRALKVSLLKELPPKDGSTSRIQIYPAPQLTCLKYTGFFLATLLCAFGFIWWFSASPDVELLYAVPVLLWRLYASGKDCYNVISYHRLEVNDGTAALIQTSLGWLEEELFSFRLNEAQIVCAESGEVELHVQNQTPVIIATQMSSSDLRRLAKILAPEPQQLPEETLPLLRVPQAW